MEYFLNPWIAEDLCQRREIQPGQRVHDIVPLRDRALDQAHPFVVRIQGVGLGIEGNGRLVGEDIEQRRQLRLCCDDGRGR